MKRYEKETAQAFLDNEKAVLNSLDKVYADAVEKIDERIAYLLGRADADMQHVIYQVEYQRMLKGQVESILRSLQTEEFETVSEYLTHCYEDGFIGALYSMQQQGVPLVFPIDQEQVARAIRHETNLSTTLYAAFDIGDLQKKIANEISRGFATAATYAEIARNVASQARIGRNNAMRIVRTEGGRIVETAAFHAQKKAQERGAQIVKIWDATLDSRVRISHLRIDGEIRELDEPFSNGLMFPKDPSGPAKEVINCRCRSRSDSKWLLDADETKWLGDVPNMSKEQKQIVSEKLGVPVDDLEQYAENIVPVRAKSYDDFKRQYNQLWHYEGSDVQRRADARIAGYKEGTDTDEMYRNRGYAHRRVAEDGHQIIDKPTYQNLTRSFVNNGGEIIRGQAAVDHLGSTHFASYLPSLNAAFIRDDATVSDVLEEMYHALQDRTNMFGSVLTKEVYLRREIAAQEYLISMTDRYKIPLEEVAVTEQNLKYYRQELEKHLNQ